MRVIGGKAGSIRLRPPHGRGVRPTIDRVKESLFASLGTVENLVVADLFSGSGALGLEALSRGAQHVIFVENDRDALRLLKENVARVTRALEDQGGEITILGTSVARLPAALPAWSGRCDLILADPPYRPEKQAYAATAMLQDKALAHWAGDALLVLEHAHGQTLPWAPDTPWQRIRQKRYGSVMLSFARQRSENRGPNRQ